MPGRALADESTQALVRFFQGQTRSLPSAGIDFEITAGFALIQTGTPDSSGRYAMVANTITQVTNDIYRLDLSLEKPQPRAIPSFDQPYYSRSSEAIISGTKTAKKFCSRSATNGSP